MHVSISNNLFRKEPLMIISLFQSISARRTPAFKACQLHSSTHHQSHTFVPRTPDPTLLVPVGEKERRHGDDHVRRDQQRSLEVIAASIQHQEVDDERTDEQTDRLEQ